MENDRLTPALAEIAAARGRTPADAALSVSALVRHVRAFPSLCADHHDKFKAVSEACRDVSASSKCAGAALLAASAPLASHDAACAHVSRWSDDCLALLQSPDPSARPLGALALAAVACSAARWPDTRRDSSSSLQKSVTAFVAWLDSAPRGPEAPAACASLVRHAPQLIKPLSARVVEALARASAAACDAGADGCAAAVAAAHVAGADAALAASILATIAASLEALVGPSASPAAAADKKQQPKQQAASLYAKVAPNASAAAGRVRAMCCAFAAHAMSVPALGVAQALEAASRVLEARPAPEAGLHVLAALPVARAAAYGLLSSVVRVLGRRVSPYLAVLRDLACAGFLYGAQDPCERAALMRYAGDVVAAAGAGGGPLIVARVLPHVLAEIKPLAALGAGASSSQQLVLLRGLHASRRRRAPTSAEEAAASQSASSAAQSSTASAAPVTPSALEAAGAALAVLEEALLAAADTVPPTQLADACALVESVLAAPVERVSPAARAAALRCLALCAVAPSPAYATLMPRTTSALRGVAATLPFVSAAGHAARNAVATCEAALHPRAMPVYVRRDEVEYPPIVLVPVAPVQSRAAPALPPAGRPSRPITPPSYAPSEYAAATVPAAAFGPLKKQTETQILPTPSPAASAAAAPAVAPAVSSPTVESSQAASVSVPVSAKKKSAKGSKANNADAEMQDEAEQSSHSRKRVAEPVKDAEPAAKKRVQEQSTPAAPQQKPAATQPKKLAAPAAVQPPADDEDEALPDIVDEGPDESDEEFV
eukprot:m51a1_g160 hypothetical protein (776) ;mRNA; f:515829-518574